MGAADRDRTFSTEDSQKLIIEKGKEVDSFFLKVFRRSHMTAPMNLIASFSGAQVRHFTSPELWLPQLAGGGKFFLQGYHESDLDKMIGSYIHFTVSEDERSVDMDATKKGDWRGPSTMEFPKVITSRVIDMPLYGVQSPPALGSGDSANRTHAWPRQAGGGVHRESMDDVAAFGPRAAALEAERRKLEAEKLEAERERAKAALEAERKEHAAEMKSLRSELMTEIRSLRDTPKKEEGPNMLMELMKQQAEDRREAARQASEDRRLERERQDKLEVRLAEDRRLDRERTDKFFERLTERKEKDPLEVLEKAASIMSKRDSGNSNEALMKAVGNAVEIQSSTMGMAMDFVDHVSRMQLGGGDQGDPPWLKGVDRLIKGFGKMAMARGATLPNLGAGAPPAGQQPAQGQPPAAGQPQQPRPPQTETNLSVIDQVEQAIRAHHNPTEIAKALISYYKDPSIQQALAEAGGDFEQAFKKRLKNWPDEAPANRAFLAKLVEELEKQLQAAGFYADEPDEDEDDDEGDDAEGDEEADEDTPE